MSLTSIYWGLGIAKSELWKVLIGGRFLIVDAKRHMGGAVVGGSRFKE